MEVKKTQKNIPSGWKEKSLLDCLKTSSKITGINLSEYEKEGNFPVFDQSQNYISGYSSRKDLVVEDVPAILFGDHTRIVKYIKSPFVSGADGTKIFWAKDGFDPIFLYYLVLNQKIPKTGYNRHFKFFKDIKVRLPVSKNEQQRIAEILGTVDEDIAKTQEVIETTEKLKRGLMQQLFIRGIGHTKFKQSKLGEIPEQWEVVLLDAVAKRGSGHTPNKKISEYYDGGIKWISLADSKFLDRGEIGKTKIEISAKGLANSSAVLHSKGTVLLSRDAGIGKSAVMGEDMAVSQHFITWACSNRLNNWYLYHYLQFQKSIFERIAMGSTIRTIGLDFFKKYEVPLPSFIEQQKISEILSEVDEKISVNKELKAKFILLKKGLMQDLLSGSIRVKE